MANWDRDAEMDGIEVRVLPRSAWGQVAPVEGVVTIELVVRNRLTTEARSAPRLERGSQGVRPADFVGGWGAVYRIPFRQIQPERQVELEPWGLVRVTLQGRGIPSLEAETPVRLRTFNPVRDELLEHSRYHDAFGRYKSRHW